MWCKLWYVAVIWGACAHLAFSQDALPAVVEVAPAETLTGKVQVIEIETTIARWQKAAAKDDDKKSAPTFDEADIAALEKSGELKVLERMRLTTVDQQKGFVQYGERVPVVTGATSGRTGAVQQSVSYQHVGTMVSVTPRVQDDTIIVEVKVERTALGDTGPVLAEVEGGDAIRATAISTTMSQTTVSLTGGKTVIVGGMTRTTKDGGAGEVVLLSAKLLK